MEYIILLVECLRIMCSMIEIYYYRQAHKNKALLESNQDDKQHLIDSESKSDDENQKI
jgi:hypothetical protein